MSWERLEKYRVKTGKTWPEVADDIGLGKSMLMMVKTGKRSLSSKALYRLEQAEIDAGIRAPPAEPPLRVAESGMRYAAGDGLFKSDETAQDQLSELREYMATEFSRLHDELKKLDKKIQGIKEGR